METWKDVVGFEGMYQVSNLGRIKSLNYSRTNKEKIMKPSLTTNGYLRVVLRKDGKSFTRAVHRLVAEAFLPNVDNLEEVNHKDECKTNNSLNNLEWCNRKYNINYGTARQRRKDTWIKRFNNGEYNFGDNLYFMGGNIGDKRKAILQLSLDFELVKEWDSAKSTLEYGFDPGTVTKCCKGKRKTHKGFLWKYKD